MKFGSIAHSLNIRQPCHKGAYEHNTRNRLDLLTVLMHQLGHVISYGHPRTGDVRQACLRRLWGCRPGAVK